MRRAFLIYGIKAADKLLGKEAEWGTIMAFHDKNLHTNVLYSEKK